MSDGTAEQVKELLEALLSALATSIDAEVQAAPARRPMVQMVNTHERIDTHADGLARLPHLVKLVDEADAQAGKTARAVAVAGAMDTAALDKLKELLGGLGIRSSVAPPPPMSAFLRDTYMAERSLREDAQRHVVGYITLFTKAAGDKSLADYNREDIIKWIRVLEQLRTSYGKRKGDDLKTVPQLIKESRGEPTLSRTTIEKHITHVKACFISGNRHFRWATADDIEDLFRDIRLSRHVPDARPRKSWTIAQLNALLGSPIWSGTRSRREEVTRRHEPGPQIHKDAYYWLPVAALWTGARLEELAQLEHDDLVRDRDGVAYLRIHSEGEHQVKTAHSVRNVPLHPFLIEVGFLDLFREGGRGRIWPELKKHGRPPSWGALYSTHFTDYRRACDLYEPLRDFHSLRRTFVTMLRTRAGVDALTVAAIVGHDDSDPELRRVQQTNDYTDYSVAALAAAVNRLDYASYGLDVSTLSRTAALCGPRGSTRTENLASDKIADTKS